MRTLGILMGIALGAGAAATGHAQAQSSGATPSVGTSGVATGISSANRENNSAYNQLVGAADQTATKVPERVSKPGKAVPATAADIKAGAQLRDVKGVPIGTIVSVDSGQAIVDTGHTKIGVPLIAFGKDDQGLLLGMTAEKFNTLVAQAHAKAQASN